MATLKELRDERLRKLEELKTLGINPYPAKTERTHTLAEIAGRFDELEGQEVSVVGRILNIRKFGKIRLSLAIAPRLVRSALAPASSVPRDMT